jgi:thiamine-phosphate diphosphorylase
MTIPALVAATDDRILERPDFPARLEALLAAGLPAVLIRNTAARSAAELFELLREVRERCSRHGAELWVGDRADLALAARADAIQLPSAGLSIPGAHAAAPGLRIGRSVHAAEEALAATLMGVDHLIVGTVFETASHGGREIAGPPLLTAVRRAIVDARAPVPPLLAIGGLTPERVGEAIRAGADGVVAIRAVWDVDPPGGGVARFLAALERSGVERSRSRSGL